MTPFRAVVTGGSIAQPVHTTTSLMEKASHASRMQEAGGRMQDAGGRTQEAGGRTQEAGRRMQEAGGRWRRRVNREALNPERKQRWCHHPVTDPDGWGLNSMNNSRSGSVNNFHSLCEEKCGRAKLKYCFSDNVGEFFHALQKHIKQTDNNLPVLSVGTGEYPPFQRHRRWIISLLQGGPLMDIMGCEDVECPSGGGSSVATRSAALLCKPA